MRKRLFLQCVLLATVLLLTACGSTRYRGESFKLKHYVAYAFVADQSDIYLVPSSGAYSSLVQSARWSVPDGVTISNASFVVSQQPVSWSTYQDITETIHYAEGIRILVTADVAISKNYSGDKTNIYVDFPGITDFAEKTGTTLKALYLPAGTTNNKGYELESFNTSATRFLALLRSYWYMLLIPVFTALLMYIEVYGKRFSAS
jgi:hypothetical protein